MIPSSPHPSSPRVTLREAFATEVFFVKMLFLLEDLPRRRSKQIRKDLRAHLADATIARGRRGALADLGPASRLAHDYQNAEGGPFPRAWSGGVAALVVGLFWSFSTLVYALGMLDASAGFAASSGGSAEASGTYLWTRVAVTYSADEMAAQFSGVGLLVMLAAMVVAYLVGARVWRLWRRG